jgi:AcrR family transcriptional regulator
MRTTGARKASPASKGVNTRVRAKLRIAEQPLRAAAAEGAETLGLRERKKARLRQQIIDTSIRLFRKQGYENTRVDDIVKILEISEPTFFRYFPSKDAVLREVGRRGFRSDSNTQ